MSDQPMTDLQREAMQKAKALIQQGQYEQARQLLVKVKHPTAQRWLDKLDERELDEALGKQDRDQARQEADAHEGRQTAMSCWQMALMFIVIAGACYFAAMLIR